MTKGEDPNRLQFLDSARGIAALAVVVQHAAEGFFPAFAWFSRAYFNFGKFGVLTFFLVSGFVIPLALEKTNSIRKFWISRFFRLFPLYWLSLALAVLLASHGLYKYPDSSFANHVGRNIIVNATMLQEFAGIPHAISLYYTLSLELLFYFIVTILFALNLTYRSTFLTWMSAAALMACTALAPLALHKRVPEAEILYLCATFFGMNFYRIYRSQTKLVVLWLPILTLVPIMAIGVYVNYCLYGRPEQPFSFAAAFLPWMTGLLIFAALFTAREATFPPILTWLGKISYSTYLLHFAFFSFVATIQSPILKFSLFVGGTLLAADLAFRCVERPFIFFGRYMASKLELPTRQPHQTSLTSA